MSDTPHVDMATAYVEGVLDGRIPACKWVRLACRRHVDDLAAGVFTFDPVRAERVCQFVSLLPHTKGEWARAKPGDPMANRIRLEPWQAFFLSSVFGWLNAEGYRRYTRASLYVPRKNGKSHLGAAIGLYMLCADGEPGAEIFCGATSEEQAWKVFGPARQMVLKTPDLIRAFGVEVNARNINVIETGSKFETIIGNPGDGDNPHLAIIDEYHEHRTNAQYNAMRSGMGARKQPLLLVITTAGTDPSSPCYDDFRSCQSVLDGTVEAPEQFALIYTVDKDDDWASPASAIKANPNYDVSVSGEFLAKELSSARRNVADQSRYKTKHLNIWVQAKDAFFNVEQWREGAIAGIELEDFAGHPVYIGMDLASKIDIAALVILLSPWGNGKWLVFGRYYLPEETIEEPRNEHYRKWRDEGWLTQTDGAIIDFGRIKEDILLLCRQFECVSLPYDPFQATQLVTELQSEGLPLIEMRPTYLTFSEPMKMLDGLIRDGKVAHNGDPVMTWMLGNVVARIDGKDNVFPFKLRAEDKIDGPVALIMAMARALVAQKPVEISAGWI